MSENIDIKVREDGAREAAVNIRDIGRAADESASRVNSLNQTTRSGSNDMGSFARQSQSARDQLRSIVAESGQATSALRRYNEEGRGLGAWLRDVAIGATVFDTMLNGITGTYNRLKELVVQIYQVVRAFTELQAEVDKLAVGFKFGAGGDETLGFANAKYINDLVQRLGLNINATADAFLKFSAATRSTSLQGEQTREIFTAISEAATVLHLSADQTSRTFLALEQMASKGVISMEELRRQLGDNLPGAFQIAARAMGVTTGELDKMVRSGTVMADDFLPKFAAQVRLEFGGSVEEASKSAQASLGRFETGWTNLKRTIADSGLGELAKRQLDILTEAMNGVTQAMQRAREEGKGFWAQMGAAAKSAGEWLLTGKVSSNEGLAAQIAQINKELQNTDLDKFQRWQLLYNRDQATKELDRRRSVRKNENAGDLIREQLALAKQEGEAIDAANAANQSRLAKYIEGNSGKHLTKDQRLSKALSAIEDDFKAATKGIDSKSKEYAEALKVAASRKDEAMDKFNRSGATSAARQLQNELGGEIAVWQGYARSRIQIEQTEQSALATLRNEGEISEREYLTRLQTVRENSIVDQQAIAQKLADIASGRRNLAERERYVARMAELEEELKTNAQKTQEALSALERKTAIAGKNALESLRSFGEQRGRAAADQLEDMVNGQNAARLNQALRAVEDRYARERLRLDQTANKLGTAGSPKYNEAVIALDNEQKSQLEKERQYHDERLRMQADWSTGAIRALNEYHDAARNVAGSVQTVFTNAFKGMEDALVNFVKTGKLDFKSLMDGLIEDLIRMEFRILMSQALSSFFGSGFGMQFAPTAGPNTGAGVGMTFSSGSLAGTGAWQTGGYTGDGNPSDVAGLVHKKEFVVNAQALERPGVRDYLEALNAGGTPPPAAAYSGTPGAPSGGSTTIAMSVNITNNASDKVNATAEQGQDENGNPTLNVLIDSVENELAGRMSSGRGRLFKATQSAFNLRPNPQGR